MSSSTAEQEYPAYRTFKYALIDDKKIGDVFEKGVHHAHMQLLQKCNNVSFVVQFPRFLLLYL